MEYVITDLKDNSMDNYLKDIITIKGLDIDKKLEMIKTYMNDVLKEKLELDRMLGTTKSIMIEVNSIELEFKLLIDNGISISVYSLEDLGSLIKKVNKDADYTDIIEYMIGLVDGVCNELDIQLVKCLYNNTTNEKLKKITGTLLENVFDKPTVKRGMFVAKEDQIIDGYTYLNSSKIDSAGFIW